MDIDRTSTVIVALPSKDGGIEPPVVQPPSGTTYHWANTSLLGDPDIKHLTQMHSDGWVYVPPNAHPTILAMTMGEAIQAQAFCLMQRPTADVQEQRARERAPHMDMDFRALALLKRYTGPAPEIIVNGMVVTVKRVEREDDNDAEYVKPLHTLDEVRAELLKRFAPADVRLYMQRHFGV